VQKILLLSGCKQAGKTTLANFLQGRKLKELELVTDFRVSSETNGKLFVRYPNKNYFEKLDFEKQRNFVTEELKPYIYRYSWADELKQLCMDTLGLTFEQCYGTESEKNTFCPRYHWKNMPGLSETEYKDRTGPMTAREIMQYVGTNIFRKIDEDIWVNKGLKRIEEDGSDMAVNMDTRFPNEIFISKLKKKAKVIRLTRRLHSQESDKSESENALNKDVFDWANFDAILDNAHMTIEESCASLLGILYGWGWIL
jgi:hypothetical protein